MKFDANTPRSELTIQGATFTVPEPFAEGHVVNANEAAALNQLVRENLRNNFASRVQKALEEVEGKVESLNVQELQTELDTYASEYEFGVRRSGVRVPSDPVGREAQKIATALVLAGLKSKGLKKDQLPEGKFEELVESTMAREDVRAAAKTRVEATTQLMGLDLGDAAAA